MTEKRAIQDHSADSRLFYGYVVVMVAFCIMFATFATRYAFGVFFKPVANEFNWTRAATSGAFSLSSILGGLIGIAIGAFTDKFGPRVVSTTCGFILALGYLCMSQVSAIWQLYLFYGVGVGVGMCGAWVPLLSTVARWFVTRRSLMSGIMLAGSAVGGLIGPPVANWLISTYNWRMSYLITGSSVLIIITLAAQFLKRDPAKTGQKPYIRIKEGEKGPKPEIEGFSLKEVVSTRQFWLTFALLFCFGFSAFTAIVHIAAHVTDLGISPSTAANILATISGAAIAGRILLGIAADRIGNRQVFTIGFIITALAMFWLVSAREAWSLYLFAVVSGFVQGGMGTSESPIVAWLFGLKSLGMIFGAVSSGFTIGAAVGPLLGGYLFDTVGSYQNTFLICALVNIAGFIFTILLKPIRGKQNEVETT